VRRVVRCAGGGGGGVGREVGGADAGREGGGEGGREYLESPREGIGFEVRRGGGPGERHLGRKKRVCLRMNGCVCMYIYQYIYVRVRVERRGVVYIDIYFILFF